MDLELHVGLAGCIIGAAASARHAGGRQRHRASARRLQGLQNQIDTHRSRARPEPLALTSADAWQRGVWRFAPNWLANAVRTHRLHASIPLLADAIGVSLASGTTLLVALNDSADRVTGPLHHDVRRACGRAATVGVTAALMEWSEATDDTSLQMLLTTLAVGASQGAAMGTVVHALSESLRDRAAAGTEARALTAQAQASAAVMIGVPIIVGGATVYGDHTALRFMFTSPIGVACTITGLALNGIGAWWMRAILRRATR